MRNSKNTFLKITIVLFGMLLLAANVAMAQVTVTLPTVVAKAGTSKTFALTVGDLTGLGVISYDLSITGNSSIVKFDSVNAGAGTLSDGMQVSKNVTAGQIYVSAAKTSPLTGSGTLLYISATMVAAGTAQLTVTLSFNEGAVATVFANQNPAIVVPELSVTLPDGTANDTLNAPKLIPVSTDDVTGKGAYSYDCTITYDATVLSVTGVDATGTISSKMTIVTNTTTPGTLIVSAAGTAPLAGAGALFNIQATLKKAGTSALAFQNFKYNDGTPAVGSVDGQMVVTIKPKTAVNMQSIPTEYALLSAYPNPFNPTTNLSFALPKESVVTLEIFNVLGMKVRTLEAGQRMSTGFHTLVWDGRDNSGSVLPSGIYIYRLIADQFTASQKMVMMK